jgi:hypothetical protein
MLRFIARDFLCGHADTKHGFDLPAFGMLVTGQVARKHFAVEVKARERVRVSPTQTIGQTEVDELLNLRIGGRGVGRPAKGCDNLASLDADEIVPEFDAVTVVIFRDDERAEGSVDVELGFVFVHVYKVAQITEKARDFFTIVQIIFVDVFSNERFILQVGTLLEQRIA